MEREQKNEKKKRKKYTIIDHTADIGLEAVGETLEEAFANAAVGMFDILSDGSFIDITTSLKVKVEGDDLQELLVNYLTELLFLYEVKGVLFGKFTVTISELGGTWELAGRAKGEMFDVRKHNYPLEIKAVTYHMLAVEDNPPLVRVIFDL